MNFRRKPRGTGPLHAKEIPSADTGKPWSAPSSAAQSREIIPENWMDELEPACATCAPGAAPATGLNVKVKGGARRGSISKQQAQEIQAFANKRGPVIVVGSGARGEAGPFSDFDYVVANSAAKQKASRSRTGPHRAPGLPRGRGGGEQTASGTDSG